MVPERSRNPLDDLLRAIADERRRRLLRVLSERPDGEATLDELAAEVSARSEDDGDPDRTAVRLHHVGLPTLDDLGVLEYDADDRTARYDGDPDVDALLDGLDGLDGDAG